MQKTPGPPKPNGPKTIDLRKVSNNHSTPTPHKPSSIVVPKKPKNRRWLRRFLVLFFVVLFCTGLYILFILLYPQLSKPSEKTIRAQAEVVVNEKNQLFIPSVGIRSEIKEGGIDILDQGVVWHRFPERGNPQKGGNFILTGHSFVWGYTPQEVTKQSVFYHLSEAKIGDEIIVHWDGTIYKYKVTGKETVKPDQTEVEKMSDKPRLTIYTCTTGGASDGRVVISAEPIK